MQRELDTSAKGSFETFAARSTNGWSGTGRLSLRGARTGKAPDFAAIVLSWY